MKNKKKKVKRTVFNFHNSVDAVIGGETRLSCPQCNMYNFSEVKDYGVTVDGELFYFVRECLVCNIGIRYCTTTDFKIVKIPKGKKTRRLHGKAEIYQGNPVKKVDMETVPLVLEIDLD